MYASDRQRHKCNAKTWTQLSECTWNTCTFQSRLKEAIPRFLNNVFSLSNLCHNIFFRRNGIRTQCFRAFLSIYIYIAHKNRQCYEYINSNLKLKYMDKRIEFISFFLISGLITHHTVQTIDNARYSS